MTQGETARKNYEMARWEMTERIQARDQTLLLYLGAIGAVFGIALGTRVEPEILFVVPFLAVGTSIIVSQHNSVIGSLGSFVVHEIGPFLKDLEEDAPQWDSSNALGEYHKTMVWLRTLGHAFLVVAPAVTALILTWPLLPVGFPNVLLWWLGLLSTVVALFFIIQSHTYRRKLHSKSGRFPDHAESTSNQNPIDLSGVNHKDT